MAYVLTFIFILASGLISLTVAAEGNLDRLKRVVEERVPGAKVEQIEPSSVPEIYQAGLAGGVVYITADGRYAFTGKLYDLMSGQDLTEPFLSKLRLKSLAAVPEERMNVFPAKGKTRHTVSTFTDIDCPYCRRMHSEMDEINGAGIQVRYLLFPRAGVNSNSYRKAVSVWCAEDKQQEMTLAKAGVDPEPRECENPVKEHMKLAERLGINGTPMSITDTGEKITGYVPAKQLLQRLEASRKKRDR